MEHSNLKNLQVGLSETCSNLSCINTINFNRGTEDISEAEKKYGLLCKYCKFSIEVRKYFIVECLYCGSLVTIVNNIKYISRKSKGYCLKCIKCGGYYYEDVVIINSLQIKLFRLINKIERLFKKEDKKRKSRLMEKERFERIMKNI